MTILTPAQVQEIEDNFDSKRVRTHWKDCWKCHHECAIDRLIASHRALEQQLATVTVERDAARRKVDELENWQKIVIGSGSDQEAVIRMSATEYTKTAVQCWKEENAKLRQRLTDLERQCVSVSKAAVDIISNVCEAHQEVIKTMGFDEFVRARPTQCIWCLHAEATRLRGALESTQWKTDQGSGIRFCSWCTSQEDEGHKPGCFIGKALTPTEVPHD